MAAEREIARLVAEALSQPALFPALYEDLPPIQFPIDRCRSWTEKANPFPQTASFPALQVSVPPPPGSKGCSICGNRSHKAAEQKADRWFHGCLQLIGNHWQQRPRGSETEMQRVFFGNDALLELPPLVFGKLLALFAPLADLDCIFTAKLEDLSAEKIAIITHHFRRPRFLLRVPLGAPFQDLRQLFPHVARGAELPLAVELVCDLDLSGGRTHHGPWLDRLIRAQLPEVVFHQVRVDRDTCPSCLGGDTHQTLLDQKLTFDQCARALAAAKIYERVRPHHWLVKGRGPGQSLATARDFAYSSNVLGVGPEAVTRVGRTFYRRSALHLDAPPSSYRTYAASRALTTAEQGLIEMLKTLETDSLIANSEPLPDHCIQFRQTLERFCKKPRLFTRRVEAFHLTDLGRLFYNDLEHYLIYELLKQDERVAYSEPKDPFVAEIESCMGPVSKTRPIKVLELGAGVGALSIPVVEHLVRQGRKLDWLAIDCDEEKLAYYSSRLTAGLKSWDEIADGAPKLSKHFPWRMRAKKQRERTFEKQDSTLRLLKNDVIEDVIFGNDPDQVLKQPSRSGQYDVIFMPSFLFHLTFKRCCLERVWAALRNGGYLILGFPSGAWMGAMVGPSGRCDGETDDELHRAYAAFWRVRLPGPIRLDLYFGRPVTEYRQWIRGPEDKLDDAPRSHELSKPPPEQCLRPPSIDTLFRIVCNKDFSFSATPREIQMVHGMDLPEAVERDIARYRHDVRQELHGFLKVLYESPSLQHKRHNSLFTYTWHILEKPGRE